MALFRKLMNASDEQQSALAGDLNAQIARAQEERQALEALVASAQAHLAQLPQVNASLEETERRATGIGQQIENLVARVEDLENINGKRRPPKPASSPSRAWRRRQKRVFSRHLRVRHKLKSTGRRSINWSRWAGARLRSSTG